MLKGTVNLFDTKVNNFHANIHQLLIDGSSQVMRLESAELCYEYQPGRAIRISRVMLSCQLLNGQFTCVMKLYC